MIVKSILRAATLSLVLAAPIWLTAHAETQAAPNGTASGTDAQSQPAQNQADASYIYPTARTGRPAAAVPGPGNSRAGGRYYDDEDQWLDRNTGVTRPGAPGEGNGGG